MGYDRDGYKDDDKKKKEKEECHCTIKIEDSIVVLICGDVDVDKLKESLEAVNGAKANKRCF
jgi:predicted Zn-dependent peptidase